MLLSFHWYCGAEPPLVIVAVKVTVPEPEQIELDVELMLMNGVTVGFTVTLLLLLVTVEAVTQVSLLSNSQFTISELFKLELLYSELLLPTGLPFNFH